MNKKDNTPEMITQSTILTMGWTKTMINNLLSEPILKPNPNYRTKSPMKLWDKSVVLKTMETAAFKEALEKVNKRRKLLEENAKNKETELSQQIVDCANSFNIRIISDDDLIKATLKDKEKRLIQSLEREIESSYDRPLSMDMDWEELNKAETDLEQLKIAGIKKPNNPAILSRWIVNYIKHNLIDNFLRYDYILNELKKSNEDKNYISFKKIILTKIATAYPKYAEECERQIRLL